MPSRVLLPLAGTFDSSGTCRIVSQQFALPSSINIFAQAETSTNCSFAVYVGPSNILSTKVDADGPGGTFQGGPYPVYSGEYVVLSVTGGTPGDTVEGTWHGVTNIDPSNFAQITPGGMGRVAQIAGIVPVINAPVTRLAVSNTPSRIGQWTQASGGQLVETIIPDATATYIQIDITPEPSTGTQSLPLFVSVVGSSSGKVYFSESFPAYQTFVSELNQAVDTQYILKVSADSADITVTASNLYDTRFPIQDADQQSLWPFTIPSFQLTSTGTWEACSSDNFGSSSLIWGWEITAIWTSTPGSPNEMRFGLISSPSGTVIDLAHAAIEGSTGQAIARSMLAQPVSPAVVGTDSDFTQTWQPAVYGLSGNYVSGALYVKR